MIASGHFLKFNLAIPLSLPLFFFFFLFTQCFLISLSSCSPVLLYLMETLIQVNYISLQQTNGGGCSGAWTPCLRPFYFHHLQQRRSLLVEAEGVKTLGGRVASKTVWGLCR